MPVSAPSTLLTASQTHSHTWKDACTATFVCAHAHTHTHRLLVRRLLLLSFCEVLADMQSRRTAPLPRPWVDHLWFCGIRGPWAWEPAEVRVQGPSRETVWGHEPGILRSPGSLRVPATFREEERNVNKGTSQRLLGSRQALRFRLCVALQQFLSAVEKHPTFGVGAGVVLLNSEAL